MFLPTLWQPTVRERTKALHDPAAEILALNWPADGCLARSVVTRSRARMTGKFPSSKMGRMVQWESRNERNSMVLLEACHWVLGYRAQPLEIRFRLGGEEHFHFPDTLVEYADTRELWEVKPRQHAIDPFVMARTQLMCSQLPKWNLTYRMVLAEDLAREPRLSLARDLLRFGRANVDAITRERVRELFQKVECVTWRSALAGHLGRYGRAALCRLTLEGRVLCDARAVLVPDTTFRWA